MFMGYLNDAEQTASVIDEQGFLKTGDIGHLDKYGFIYITGRLKVNISLTRSKLSQFGGRP